MRRQRLERDAGRRQARHHAGDALGPDRIGDDQLAAEAQRHVAWPIQVRRRRRAHERAVVRRTGGRKPAELCGCGPRALDDLQRSMSRGPARGLGGAIVEASHHARALWNLMISLLRKQAVV